jgi:hypothetical protein
LSCHNTGQELVDGQPFSAAVIEGVGCESCHGAARDWKSTHYVKDSGKQPNSRPSDLGSPVIKAQVCAGCHVAGRGIVDHDLIAAGHPAMKFELTAYFDHLSKSPAAHWRPKDKNSTEWLAGQLAVASAAVNGVKKSLQNDQNRGLDLAEFDCAACHHHLSGVDRSKPRDHSVPRPILPEWGTWNLGLLDVAAGVEGTGAPKGTGKALGALRKALQNPLASPKDLRKPCDDVSERLAEWNRSEALKAKSLTALRTVAMEAADLKPNVKQPIDWDRAVQTLYLIRAISPGDEQQQLMEELKFRSYQTGSGTVGDMRAESKTDNYNERVRNLLHSAAAALPD